MHAKHNKDFHFLSFLCAPGDFEDFIEYFPVISGGVNIDAQRPGRKRDKNDMRAASAREFAHCVEASAGGVQMHVVVEDGDGQGQNFPAPIPISPSSCAASSTHASRSLRSM